MAQNSIIVKRHGAEVIEEYTATAVAITPGYLVELTSSGTVQAHSTASGDVFPMFAIEDQFQGGAISTNYAASAPLQCWIPRRGDVVYAMLEDGQTATVGSFLESSGSGTLNVYALDAPSEQQYPAGIVGVALEAVDLSASANTTDARIMVRIL